MNAKQKLVRWIGLGILLSMAFFPPWQLSYTSGESKHSSPAGYHPVWNPPAREVDVDESASNIVYRVDFVRLGFQLVGVLILINAGVFFLKSSAGAVSPK